MPDIPEIKVAGGWSKGDAKAFVKNARRRAESECTWLDNGFAYNVRMGALAREFVTIVLSQHGTVQDTEDLRALWIDMKEAAGLND